MADTGRKQPVEILTRSEVTALMRQCSVRAPTGLRNRALIAVMYRAGLRLDEALALKPSDIDPQRGTIRVLHGKGDRDRTVSLDEGGTAIVQQWMIRRSALRLRNGLLFCTLDGNPVKAVYVRNLMKRLARKAGIEKRVHPHGLRHAHAAELAVEGWPMNLIQQQLGHASLLTTDVYLRHISPAELIALGKSRQWNLEESSA
jgi:site-specific recombinase XerD